MPAAPHIPQLLGGFPIRGIADLPPLIRKSPYKTSPYSGGLFVPGKYYRMVYSMVRYGTVRYQSQTTNHNFNDLPKY